MLKLFQLQVIAIIPVRQLHKRQHPESKFYCRIRLLRFFYKRNFSLGNFRGNLFVEFWKSELYTKLSDPQLLFRKICDESVQPFRSWEPASFWT